MVPSRARKRRWRGGFTLVEVLSAVVILSIALLAILTAMQAARDSQQRAVYMNIAMNAAQSQIEGLRSRQWYNITAPANTSIPSLPAGNVMSVTVQKYPTGSEDKLYLVTVRVTWPEGNATRQWTYETLITKYS